MVTVYGRLLDNKKWKQRTRAWIALAFWAVPQAACLVWTGVIFAQVWQRKNSFRL